MWNVSDYSLNYAALLASGEMDIFAFLSRCRTLGLDGASLHVRDLASTESGFLRSVRRSLLDNHLSLSMCTVTTNFGRPETEHAEELAKARQAIHASAFLGAPLLRVFAGSPPVEMERAAAFDRAATAIRKVCEEAAGVGLAIGLQNHNHGALCRTGEELLRFSRQVDHANLVLVLDTGQFAGSPGASGRDRPLHDAPDYLESIRLVAPLARRVRTKFYQPRADGSDAALDYARIFDILRSVHYTGFLDIVYEGRALGGNEDPRTAIARIARFLVAQAPAPAAVVAADEGRYGGLDSAALFTAAAVADETQVAFLEGPACDRAGRVFFTNTTAERIMLWEPATRRLSVFREASNAANGLAFDRQGRLLACEGGAGRVTRTDMASGAVDVLADSFQGKPIGATNDLALDAKDRIYFTSRFGTELESGQVNAVYRIDPDGRVERLLATPEIDMPNGIVTSPDDKTLYLIDADPRADHARRIRAYELRDDGSVGGERLLYDFYPGRSGDGMAIDAEGNLYVAAGLHARRGTSETLDTRPGIHVISPGGKLLAFIATPEDTITNCTFGGDELRTLYITCGKRLLSLRTKIPGKASYRPQR